MYGTSFWIYIFNTEIQMNTCHSYTIKLFIRMNNEKNGCCFFFIFENEEKTKRKWNHKSNQENKMMTILCAIALNKIQACCQYAQSTCLIVIFYVFAWIVETFVILHRIQESIITELILIGIGWDHTACNRSCYSNYIFGRY